MFVVFCLGFFFFNSLSPLPPPRAVGWGWGVGGGIVLEAPKAFGEDRTEILLRRIKKCLITARKMGDRPKFPSNEDV